MNFRLKESRKDYIWASDAQREYYWDMSVEELRNEVRSMGGEEDFEFEYDIPIEEADEEDLLDFLMPDDVDLDYEDFTENIMPMIENQCKGDVLVLFGSAANWRGTREACAVIKPEEFEHYIYPGYEATSKIYSDNGNLYYTQSSHDTPMGGTVIYLYSFKSDADYDKAEEMMSYDDLVFGPEDWDYKAVGELIKAGLLTPVRNSFNESLKEDWVDDYLADAHRERDNYQDFGDDSILDSLGSDYECVVAMYDMLGYNTDDEFFYETVEDDWDYGRLEIENGKLILNKDGKTIMCSGRDTSNFPIVWEETNEDLKEGYTQKELMDAVEATYGYKGKKARDYIKSIDDKTANELVKGFKSNAKKSFYTEAMDTNQIREQVESLIDDIDAFEGDLSRCSVTWNFGEDDNGNLTGGVDLRLHPSLEDDEKACQELCSELETIFRNNGFALDSRFRNPRKGLFGSYHYQIIRNEDLDECNIAEAYNLEEARYSDAYDDETRQNGWWYFTTHGVGPGSVPKDLHVLETREGQNDKGTWGDYVKLDGILNTDELKYYDMRELSPMKEEFSGFFSDYDFDESLDEGATSNKKFLIKYGKGRPGGDSEVVEFPSGKEARQYAADHAKGWGFEVSPFNESLNEEKTPYGDTTIEDYINANFSGSDADKQKLISAMKKKVNGKDYFNGLNMSVKDWENAGKKFGLSMKRHPVTENKKLNEAGKWSNKYPQYEYTFDDGWKITAVDEKEAMAKYDDIQKNRYKGVRSKEELDNIAQQLYNERDEWSFNYFSDKELAILWALCSNPMSAPAYDDEVYDAIMNNPKASKIFKDAEKQFKILGLDKGIEHALHEGGERAINKAMKDKEKIAKKYDVFPTAIVWRGGNKFTVVKNGKEIEVNSESLEEDTEKNSKGKWVNKGDSGETHGEFKTKKEADAQRKAMFANGYKG